MSTNSMSAQHTPGWHVGRAEGGGKYVFVPGNAKPINAGSAERAALIVRSVLIAPDLLAALHQIANGTTDPAAREIARATIAKATGSAA